MNNEIRAKEKFKEGIRENKRTNTVKEEDKDKKFILI
jgi:hypothetical protein